MSALPWNASSVGDAVLPAEARAALAAIADELRHLPRDCIVDRAELLCWLNRLANRVERVQETRAPVTGGGTRRENRGDFSTMRRCSTHGNGTRSHPIATAREIAEGVFGKGATKSPLPPKPRTVTNRAGKQVRVEVRRKTQPSRQIEMQLWGEPN